MKARKFCVKMSTKTKITLHRNILPNDPSLVPVIHMSTSVGSREAKCRCREVCIVNKIISKVIYWIQSSLYIKKQY